MTLFDTSIVVAAGLAWHVHHERAKGAMHSDNGGRIIGQVGFETYSVLTRLPGGRHISPRDAHAYLKATFPLGPVTLDSHRHDETLQLMAEKDIRGGAVYDALVAATAKQEGAILFTLDQRATGIYTAVGVDFRLI